MNNIKESEPTTLKKIQNCCPILRFIFFYILCMNYVPIYLLIYGLFNKTVHRSDYLLLNGIKVDI